MAPGCFLLERAAVRTVRRWDPGTPAPRARGAATCWDPARQPTVMSRPASNPGRLAAVRWRFSGPA